MRKENCMARTRTIVVVAVLWGAIAQGAADAQQLSQLVRGNGLRCSIVDGRVTVDASQSGGMSSITRHGAHGKEVLNIRNENGQSALNYERTADGEQLTIEITGSGQRVLIRRIPRGSSSILPVEFKQAANERIVLALGSGAGKQVFRAHGIWQLLIAQPQPCRQHLLPLLELLRPDWKLADTAARVEERLLRELGGDGAAKRAHWAALVAQLADESFANRQAAARRIGIVQWPDHIGVFNGAGSDVGAQGLSGHRDRL
jgi:hypothetical protein